MGYQVRFDPRLTRALSRHSEAIADVAKAFPSPQIKASRVAAKFMAEESRRRQTWKKIALNGRRSPLDGLRAKYDSDPEFRRRWKDLVGGRLAHNAFTRVRENTLRLGLGSDLTRFAPGAGVKRAAVAGAYRGLNASKPYAGKIQLLIHQPDFQSQRLRFIPYELETDSVETVDNEALEHLPELESFDAPTQRTERSFLWWVDEYGTVILVVLTASGVVIAAMTFYLNLLIYLDS